QPEQVELGGGGEDAARHHGDGAGHGDAEDRQAAAEQQGGGRLPALEGRHDHLLGDAADDGGGGDLQQGEAGRPEHGQDEPAPRLRGALQQWLPARDQRGGMLARGEGRIGRGGATGARRVGGAGAGGGVGAGHAETKWTTTATAKAIVESMARENSMRMPRPRAFIAIQAEVRPFRQSSCRTASQVYRPSRKPSGRPRNGITKMPTIPEAIAT